MCVNEIGLKSASDDDHDGMTLMMCLFMTVMATTR